MFSLINISTLLFSLLSFEMHSVTIYFSSLDATVYIPSFDGTSYLELQPLAFLLQSSGDTSNQLSSVKDATISLTVKTRSTQGTILFSEYSLLFEGNV